MKASRIPEGTKGFAALFVACNRGAPWPDVTAKASKALGALNALCLAIEYESTSQGICSPCTEKHFGWQIQKCV